MVFPESGSVREYRSFSMLLLRAGFERSFEAAQETRHCLWSQADLVLTSGSFYLWSDLGVTSEPTKVNSQIKSTDLKDFKSSEKR